MNRSDGTRRLLPGLALATLATAAFSLSSRLSAVTTAPAAPGRPSVMAALLGRSRVAAAAYAFDVADLYFHRGIDHEHETAFDDSWIQRLGRQVTPAGHLHAHGEALPEIMPWLRLATRMDPHSLDAYLVSAFWLVHGSGRIDLAHDVLREALAYNPGTYLIPIERARLFLRENRLDEAMRALNAALAFWPETADRDAPEALDDKARILLYRGLVYEARDDRSAAAADLRAILDIFPDRDGLRERIHMLETGLEPALAARGVWDRLLHDEDHARVPCHDPAHAHDAAPPPTHTHSAECRGH